MGNGLALVIVVGQNDYQYPATIADAKQYKQKHGYPDAADAVADPNWKSLDSVIWDSTGTLPGFHVLDGTGKLRFAHDSWNGLSAAENVIVQILNGN